MKFSADGMDEPVHAYYYSVDPAFFDVFALRIISGRPFSGEFGAETDKIIINERAINAYGLGIPGTELTYADTSQAEPPYNPYNSYKITGLPPTPIASPGEVSIDAVLNPADGPWLFWVTVNLDTGETKFAETFAEHQTYVDELREWQAANQ